MEVFSNTHETHSYLKRTFVKMLYLGFRNVYTDFKMFLLFIECIDLSFSSSGVLDKSSTFSGCAISLLEAMVLLNLKTWLV